MKGGLFFAFGRRARAARHEDLSDSVFKGPQGLLVDLRGASHHREMDASRRDAESHPQERLRRHLLGRLVLEVPDAVAVRERLEVHAALGLDADLEPASRGASTLGRS